ncbi:MAG: sigma-70 family RNA polymerase sigma factor [Verrucomicrobiota bacterium]
MGEETPKSSEQDALKDEELVKSILAGNVDDYDGLVRRYADRLYAVIYNMTSNHEDTNDLLMEVFDKAFRNLPKYKRNSSFYTWIYRVAVNHTLNYIQKNKKRRKNMSLNDLNIDDRFEKDLEDLKVITGDKSAELEELQKKLNESLQKLSDEHRTVVILYDIDGMAHADIAKTLNCSEGTVRSRLHYAHKHLQKLLNPYLDIE